MNNDDAYARGLRLICDLECENDRLYVYIHHMLSFNLVTYLPLVSPVHVSVDDAIRELYG
jgi:hypothetical protein